MWVKMCHKNRNPVCSAHELWIAVEIRADVCPVYRHSFMINLTSCDKSCCYTTNSAAVIWFFKGIVHPKMKIHHHLLYHIVPNVQFSFFLSVKHKRCFLLFLTKSNCMVLEDLKKIYGQLLWLLWGWPFTVCRSSGILLNIKLYCFSWKKVNN